jgi:hypothetical protein
MSNKLRDSFNRFYGGHNEKNFNAKHPRAKQGLSMIIDNLTPKSLEDVAATLAADVAKRLRDRVLGRHAAVPEIGGVAYVLFTVPPVRFTLTGNRLVAETQFSDTGNAHPPDYVETLAELIPSNRKSK